MISPKQKSSVYFNQNFVSQKENKILAIDLGNTNIHWCYINNGIIDGKYSIIKNFDFCNLSWDEIKKQDLPVVIAGATHYLAKDLKEIKKRFNIKFIELTSDKQSTIKNIYPGLGIDRICNLTAAFKYFQKNEKNLKSNIIVFDFGTATTVSCCDQSGQFIGGLIHSGIETELKAVSREMPALPKVEIAKVQSKINSLPTNTEEAILNAVLIGQIGFINHFLDLFKEKHGEAKIVFTGGNAELILKLSNIQHDLFDPLLTVKGIYYNYTGKLVHK